MDGWNTSFLLGWPIFRGYVSFREGNPPFTFFISVKQFTNPYYISSSVLRWQPGSDPKATSGQTLGWSWVDVFLDVLKGDIYMDISKNRGGISPKTDGLQWKNLLKWMIWGYPYFWKHPYTCKNRLFGPIIATISRWLVTLNGGDCN